MVHEPSFQLWRDSWFTEVSEKQHAEARVWSHDVLERVRENYQERQEHWGKVTERGSHVRGLEGYRVGRVRAETVGGDWTWADRNKRRPCCFASLDKGKEESCYLCTVSLLATKISVHPGKEQVPMWMWPRYSRWGSSLTLLCGTTQSPGSSSCVSTGCHKLPVDGNKAMQMA